MSSNHNHEKLGLIFDYVNEYFEKTFNVSLPPCPNFFSATFVVFYTINFKIKKEPREQK
jgi:hypothetical protein